MKGKLLNASRLRRLAPDVCAVAFLAAFLGFFYWGFLNGRCFIWNDTLTEFYPGVNYFAKSVQGGRLPLWFPGVRDGSPFYSDLQVGGYYPAQWLLIPFVHNGRLPFVAYQRYIVLHYLFGGLFTYAFLKRLKLSPIAAVTGALVFCFSGFASLRIASFAAFQPVAWLPLQLLFVHRLTRDRRRLSWLGLVGAMVASLLAGFPQATLYCWYLVTAYWLYRCYCVHREEVSSPRMAVRRVARRDLPKIVGTFVLVFGLAAIMVVPGAENWWRTARPNRLFEAEALADSSLPYDQILKLFVPNFFGTSQSAGSPVPFWGVDPHSQTVMINGSVGAKPGFWQYWEFGAYSGQIFWLALFLILFNWRRIEDKRGLGFWLAIWAAATWFMLGRYGGLFQILYRILPGVSLFRVPARMSSVATFAAATLCAHGVDLIRHRARGLRPWPVLLPVAGFACLALVLYAGGELLSGGLRNLDRLTWSRHETSFALVLAILCALAVLGVIRNQTRWIQTACLCSLLLVSAADFYHAYGSFHRGAVSPDECYPDTSRLLSLLKDYREQRGPFRFGQIIQGRVGEEIATFRNLPYFHEFLEVPEGFTSFYLDSVRRFQTITNQAAKIDIQNIKVTMERDENGKDWLGTRTNSLPRAQFFARIRRYDSRGELLAALERGDIDWHNEVAVSEPFSFDGLRGDEPNRGAGDNDSVQFQSLTPESYSITYSVSRPGIVFISEAFYPGWAPDDEHTKLIEVFGAFQGLVIPQAGTGRIVVRFSPPALKLGATISIISIMATALLCLGKRSRGSNNG
jgi:hypothetical protein